MVNSQSDIVAAAVERTRQIACKGKFPAAQSHPVMRNRKALMHSDLERMIKPSK